MQLINNVHKERYKKFQNKGQSTTFHNSNPFPILNFYGLTPKNTF